MCLKKPMQTNSPCLEYCLLDFLVRKLHSIEFKIPKVISFDTESCMR